jgi:predicted acetyltransferase
VKHVVRPCTPDDQAEVLRLWEIAFGGGQVQSSTRDHFPPFEPVYLVPGAHGIQGALKIHDFEAHCRGAWLPCGGIGGVAVMPEARQSGVAAAMMQSSLRTMYEGGVCLSNLYAFRESFYRRFGWECVGSRVRITCPNHRLPRLKSELESRRLNLADWPQLEAAYATFAANYSGMCRRDAARWEHFQHLTDPAPLVFAVGDPVEAYAIARATARSWKQQEVLEVVWASPRGYRAVLSLISGLTFNHAALTWQEPGDGPFCTGWFDQGVEVQLVRPWMYRVVHLPRTLAALHSEGTGQFTLAVEDPHLPENQGPWRVSFEDGVTRVEPTGGASGDADLVTTIGHFTQAVLGEPSLGQLIRQGFVTVHDPAAADAAQRWLTPQRIFCLEAF